MPVIDVDAASDAPDDVTSAADAAPEAGRPRSVLEEFEDPWLKPAR